MRNPFFSFSYASALFGVPSVGVQRLFLGFPPPPLSSVGLHPMIMISVVLLADRNSLFPPFFTGPLALSHPRLTFTPCEVRFSSPQDPQVARHLNAPPARPLSQGNSLPNCRAAKQARGPSAETAEIRELPTFFQVFCMENALAPARQL